MDKKISRHRITRTDVQLMTFFFNPLFPRLHSFLVLFLVDKNMRLITRGVEGGVRAHAKSVCFFLASFLCFLFFGTVGLPAQKKDKQDLCLPSKYDRYRPINLLFEKLFCQFLVYHIFRLTPFFKNRFNVVSSCLMDCVQ